MKRFIYVSLLALSMCFNYAHAQILATNQEEIHSLDEVAEWVVDNISFPQEAYKYGISGIEQFAISSSWDGKVFITSPLNTLNPAFEQEIISVVSRAPKCTLEDSDKYDIYRAIQIDFSSQIPDSLKHTMKLVTFHMPPQLETIHSPILSNKETLIEWIYEKYRIPKEMKKSSFVDTISINYTIKSNGKIKNIYVDDCDNELISKEIEDVIKKTSWTPAQANHTEYVDVSIADKMIISFDSNRAKKPFMAYVDEVFLNSNIVSDNPEMIVLNPEVKPIYNRDSNDSGKQFSYAITDGVEAESEIHIGGGVVIERDGSVSSIEMMSSDNTKMDSIIIERIKRSRWTPALQADKPVRTFHSFGAIIKSENRRRYYSHNDTPYDIHGKYYLSLIASPNKRSYIYYNNGILYQHPFNSSGATNSDAYNRAKAEYLRKGGISRNFDKKYYDKMYRLYAR